MPASLKAEDDKTEYVYLEVLEDTTAMEMQAHLTYPGIDLVVEL